RAFAEALPFLGRRAGLPDLFGVVWRSRRNVGAARQREVSGRAAAVWHDRLWQHREALACRLVGLFAGRAGALAIPDRSAGVDRRLGHSAGLSQRSLPDLFLLALA